MVAHLNGSKEKGYCKKIKQNYYEKKLVASNRFNDHLYEPGGCFVCTKY